jgi:non-canonical purine NTP pyrophosphatase (RdgB/HAM1 family)
MKLIVASHNDHKVEEIQAILGHNMPSLQCVSLKALDWTQPIEEDGLTFAANALKKAKTVGDAHPTQWVLADDSGLVVPSLNGAPGVHSARYAGPNASDAQNNQKLLDALNGASAEAHFECQMVLYRCNDRMWTTRGELHGTIATQAKGAHGFGYDPIFHMPDHGCSLAEMSASQKNKISHRTQALQALIPIIQEQILPTTP